MHACVCKRASVSMYAYACICICTRVTSAAILSQAMKVFESRKRPRSPDRYPVWDWKQRCLDPAGLGSALAISEDDAAQIMTGAVTVSEAKALEAAADASAEASATEVAHSAAAKMTAAQDMFVGRCDNAALTFEMLEAYGIAQAECKAVESDKSQESCGRECARLRKAAHATCKAQTAAWKAALAAQNALDAFCKAALTAEAENSQFRRCRENTQMIAACQLDMEVRYKDSPVIQLRNGACAVENLEPDLVGDLMRGLFVRIISDDAASWSNGFLTCIEANDADTIAEVKAKLQDKEGIPPEKIRLAYKGQKLRSQETLASYGIVDDDGKTDFIVWGVMLPETIPLPPKR